MKSTCRWPSGCAQPPYARDHCRRHYMKLRNTGRIHTSLVEPGPARERIQTHLDRGRTLHSLADLVGIDDDHLSGIHHGQASRIRRRTEQKIMAAPLRPTSVGCLRRVNALRRLGHSISTISAAGGMSVGGLKSAIHRGYWTDAAASSVQRAYEALSAVVGTSRHATEWAVQHGWAAPLAWDGIDVDDPAAAPVGNRAAARRKRVAGRGRAHSSGRRAA